MLQFMGSQRVGQDCAIELMLYIFSFWKHIIRCREEVLIMMKAGALEGNIHTLKNVSNLYSYHLC